MAHRRSWAIRDCLCCWHVTDHYQESFGNEIIQLRFTVDLLWARYSAKQMKHTTDAVHILPDHTVRVESKITAVWVYDSGLSGQQREYTAVGLNQLVIRTEVEQKLIILFMSCSSLIPTNLYHKTKWLWKITEISSKDTNDVSMPTLSHSNAPMSSMDHPDSLLLLTEDWRDLHVYYECLTK